MAGSEDSVASGSFCPSLRSASPPEWHHDCLARIQILRKRTKDLYFNSVQSFLVSEAMMESPTHLGSITQ